MAPAFYNSLHAFIEAPLVSVPSPWRVAKALAAVLAVGSFDRPAVPGFEIMLGLTNATLTGLEPSAELKDMFNLEPSGDAHSYSYYDTDDGTQAFNSEGWAIRLRHKEDDDFELVYKKRFVVNDEEGGGGLDAAVRLAHNAGFGQSDGNYESEVDWMYTKRVLSFTLKTERSAKQHPGTLLDRKKQWGTKFLEKTRSHGPVTSKVYSGQWEDLKVKIEVLPIKTEDGNGFEHMVELSFGADDEKEATKLRENAMTRLKQVGWLLDHDMLKTRLVLGRY